MSVSWTNTGPAYSVPSGNKRPQLRDRNRGGVRSYRAAGSQAQVEGRTVFKGRYLLRQVGEVLLIQHRMMGRVEVADKPEILWEHPELERLYARLEAEYELRERARALERKFDVIANTSEMLMGLLESKRSLSIEFYIMVLIVIEILLSIFTIISQGVFRAFADSLQIRVPDAAFSTHFLPRLASSTSRTER